MFGEIQTELDPCFTTLAYAIDFAPDLVDSFQIWPKSGQNLSMLSGRISSAESGPESIYCGPISTEFGPIWTNAGMMSTNMSGLGVGRIPVPPARYSFFVGGNQCWPADRNNETSQQMTENCGAISSSRFDQI